MSEVMRDHPSRIKCYAQGYARSYERLVMLCAGLCAGAKSVTKVMRGCPARITYYARVMRGLCAGYARSYTQHLHKLTYDLNLPYLVACGSVTAHLIDY